MRWIWFGQKSYCSVNASLELTRKTFLFSWFFLNLCWTTHCRACELCLCACVWMTSSLMTSCSTEKHGARGSSRGGSSVLGRGGRSRETRCLGNARRHGDTALGARRARPSRAGSVLLVSPADRDVFKPLPQRRLRGTGPGGDQRQEPVEGLSRIRQWLAGGRDKRKVCEEINLRLFSKRHSSLCGWNALRQRLRHRYRLRQLPEFLSYSCETTCSMSQTTGGGW